MSLFTYFLWCGFTGLAEEGVPGLMRCSGLCVWGHQRPLLMHELWEVRGQLCIQRLRAPASPTSFAVCSPQSSPLGWSARLGSSLIWPHRPAWPLCPPGTRVLALPFFCLPLLSFQSWLYCHHLRGASGCPPAADGVLLASPRHLPPAGFVLFDESTHSLRDQTLS